MTWKEIGEMFDMNKDAVRMKAVRSGLTKEQLVEVLKSEQSEQISSEHKPKKENEQMERRLQRTPFSFRTYNTVQDFKVEQKSEQTGEHPTQSAENQTNFVHPEHKNEQKSEQPKVNTGEQLKERIDNWMIENTGKITAVLKSNFLSVVVMLTLSIVVATVFTSRVALAVGVTPVFAYSIAILVDVSAIIFMFRGKKWLSWVFGLNIFLQIALTSESTLARIWFSQETVLGIKVVLLATAVLTAIEGFSSLSSQNKG